MEIISRPYLSVLFLYTKMRNVSGISQTEAFKSSDLYMKCRYLDELTDRKGIVFATGTPISNSMVELYTMQRYLQYGDLQEKRLEHFDAWASTFGETTTAIELSPEGNGYRAKTRFAKFYNLPELMSMFKEIANIQTAEMLKLPVPKANYHNIVVKPNELQKEMVAELGKRAEEVREGAISSSEDNMLKITNDGRKLALDIRLINELLPDFENNKVSVCSNNVFKIWEDTKEKRLTQLIFCDLSTPHKDGRFNVYDDLKQKLIEKGIPEEEIAFIHDAETESKKKELFSKVRKGNIRILIGSTQKMGAGTNVQNKLIALHDLDCPWRPSDLIQRSGRIIRQGNQNEEVNIYRYVTEGTFDAYLYQLVENKQRFISQIMTDKSPVRSAEDIDETALSYAEIKALAVGNPLIIEKTSLDAEVTKLKLLKQSFLSQIYSIEDSIVKYYPSEIKRLEEVEKALICDIQTVNENTNLNEDNFSTMLVNEKIYNKKADAGQAILEMCKNIKGTDSICIGEYRGLKMELYFESLSKQFGIKLKGKSTYNVSLGYDIYGNIARIDNTINAINNELEKTKIKLQEIMRQFENAKEEVKKTFPQEDILKEKSERLEELNILLNLNEKDRQVIDEEFEEVEKSQRCKKDYER